MKKLITAVVFLLISTALVAQSNTATTTQTGDENDAILTQTGLSNEAEAGQFGNLNEATLGQNGNANIALADQLHGDENTANISQLGSTNEAYLVQGMVEDYYGIYGITTTNMISNNNTGAAIQDGNGNLVDFLQVGNSNNGTITQIGDNNKGYAYQGWAGDWWGFDGIVASLYSDDSKANISQLSNNNNGQVYQYGGNNNEANISQSIGDNNKATIAQGFIYDDYAYNFSYPVYNTQDNFGNIQQFGTDNFGKVFQLGDGNSFELTQNGDANSVGKSPLGGLLNVRNGYFAQDGNGNIFVGTQNDGATLSHESFQFGDDNEIDLIQGEGDVALIQQTGDMNNANVSQYSLTNDASVMQNGDNNTANVTQSN